MAEVKWIGCASRNFKTGRPSHLSIKAVVIHIIDGSQAGADATFLDNTLTNPRSAHYSVGRSGNVHQYVQEQDTAYHAGVVVQPTWAFMETQKTAAGNYINPNFYTIGIEHEGKADDDWTDAMYAASSDLISSLSQKYDSLKTLTRDNVVMHREIRANKSCPGSKVDMFRLISEAMRPPQDDVSPNLVVTISAVNLRSGSPSRSGMVSRLLPPNTLVHTVRLVPGEAVPNRDNQPIDRWYQTVDGEFLWSGAAAPVERSANLGRLESI